MLTTATEPWQHRDILTNDLRMHYVTQGTGPLVVLLHGFPEFWYSWRWQIPFLAEHGYRVVAPDLRGYNRTEKPARGYDIPTLLRDIAGLIEGLGEERAIIVGHDWGGVLAWHFAIDYPQMTSKLIVMNAPHPGAMMRELRTPAQMRKSWYILAFQIPWLPEYLLTRNHASAISSMIYRSAVQKDAFTPETLARYEEAMSIPGALPAALNYYRQLLRHGLRHYRSRTMRVDAPTLLIWGEQDIALGIELTHDLNEWVPDLQVRYLPNSGHWVQQEQPDEVNRLVLKFLQTSDARA